MRAFIRATIVCALTLMSAQTIAAQIVDGKDFRTLNPAVETTEDTIEVIDFFAYTCGHCLRLAPLLDEWQKKITPRCLFPTSSRCLGTRHAVSLPNLLHL